VTSTRPLHPLVQHALFERRAVLRGLAAAAVAGGTAGLLGCSEDSAQAGGTTSTSTTTSLPPIAHTDELPYWMQGGFEPVHEEVEAFDLEVTGALPPELEGLYARNGSNPASGTSPHWFLGDGMVHGVALGGGAALWYRNRYVDTPMQRSGKGVFGSGAPGGPNNQSNVSVFHHGGRLLSSGEIGHPYELSARDLSTTGPYDYDGRLTTAMTAHPKQDPDTGELHFFGYGFVPPYLTYHVADASGALRLSEQVDVAGPTMMHDFAITDRDVVFWELPVVFDLDAALAAMEGVEGQFGFRWDPSYGARIGVMPLGGPASAIRWVEIDPCFAFHGVNAHRDGDRIVVDICVMPEAFGERDGDSLPHRWTIDTSGDQLRFHDEVLVERPMDLPVIDRRFTGRRNEQAWYLLTESLPGYPIEFAGIGRRDGRSGTFDEYAPGPGERVNEGVIVPGGDAEGEGWLLTYAWDRARGASDLLVLDALDLAAGPVARVHLPVRVPYGFHGTWVPGAI
jgi:carotenoid cleavage dioxygenase-like enzyme